MTDFTKLSSLVDQDFTVVEAGGYQWKKWDNEAKRMLVEERWQEGFRKIYSVTTDKGKLDLGPGQLSSLLEATYKNGRADINGQTFHVKSNGKTGMDIRYFFNLVREPKQDTVVDVNDEEEISLSDIPF